MKQWILSNASICSPKPELPTIQIKEGEPGSDQALENWKAGKNPTDSAEWKKGVYLRVVKK